MQKNGVSPVSSEHACKGWLLINQDLLLIQAKIGNQITPFNIKTADGESIYAWHILPLPLYLQHEATLASRDPGVVKDITTAPSFRLLKDDPEARLVLYCMSDIEHGYALTNCKYGMAC